MWRGLDHCGRGHAINPLAMHEFESRWIAFSLYGEVRFDIGDRVCEVVKEPYLGIYFTRYQAGMFCDAALGPR